jgi:glycine cleavage system H protein
MDIPSYTVPEGLRYSKEHEWVKVEDNVAIIGITDYAVRSLHDVVYVSLPEVGLKIDQGSVASTVESIKAVSEVYSPVGGIVVEVNKALDTNPEKINTSAYGEGWIFKLKPINLEGDFKKLMKSGEYLAYLDSLKKQSYL